MSRGIGKLQRAILAEFETPGPLGNWEYDTRNQLPDDCRDRRALCRQLARHMGGMDRGTWISIAWSASYSRALRTLFERGELERPHLVRLPSSPLWNPKDEYGARGLHFLSDGVYLRSPKWLLRRTFKTPTGLADPDKVARMEREEAARDAWLYSEIVGRKVNLADFSSNS